MHEEKAILDEDPEVKARKKRARLLRKQISELIAPAEEEGEGAETAAAGARKPKRKRGESPRDFIHRRMEELRRKKS